MNGDAGDWAVGRDDVADGVVVMCNEIGKRTGKTHPMKARRQRAADSFAVDAASMASPHAGFQSTAQLSTVGCGLKPGRLYLISQASYGPSYAARLLMILVKPLTNYHVDFRAPATVMGRPPDLTCTRSPGFQCFFCF